MKLIVRRYENSASGERFNLSVTYDRVGLFKDRPERSPPGSKPRGRDSVSRAISTVREYGLSNEWDYFVLFTFRDGAVPDLMDIDDLAHRIGRRFRHIREDFPGYACDYLIVPEIHPERRERIHFHGFLRDIPPDIIYRNKAGYWALKPFESSFGFANISPVENVEACSFYMLKYVCKDLATLRKNDGGHLYYHSRGLKKFEVVSKTFYPCLERLLHEAGFEKNYEYEFFSMKGLRSEVAAAVLDYINDDFLQKVYSESEVFNNAKCTMQIDGDFHPEGTPGKDGGQLQLFGV